MKWIEGVTLKTATTQKWSKEEIDANNVQESQLIFSHFSGIDGGRSRQLVCTLHPIHPDYEDNKKLILNAPQTKQEHTLMYEALRLMVREFNGTFDTRKISPAGNAYNMASDLINSIENH